MVYNVLRFGFVSGGGFALWTIRLCYLILYAVVKLSYLASSYQHLLTAETYVLTKFKEIIVTLTHLVPLSVEILPDEFNYHHRNM